MTALHFSALNGSVEMTKFLCLHNANPHSQSEIGDTPLHLAIRRRILVMGYDDYWITGDYSIEDLLNFITNWEGEEAHKIFDQIATPRLHTVDVLLNFSSIDVNIANNQGDCPLHVIPFNEWYASDILLKLIKKGADLSKSNNRGQTCLHLACQAGNLDAVRKLTSRDCSITVQDKYGLSPLHYAVGEDHIEVVRYLLKWHHQQSLENRQQSDFLQMKLLHHHAKSDFGSIEIIDLLSQFGFDLNILDDNGESVLSLYLRSFHLHFKVDIFNCLLRHGANTAWLSEKGENMIHLVMHQWDSGNSLVLESLLQSLDIRAKDAEGRNVLHHGAIHGAFNEKLTTFLRERDIRHLLGENDSSGKTPLDYAEEEARRERHPDLFKGSRWHESLHNLQTLQAFTLQQ
jgi:ankyrin repeat protein